MAWPAWINYDVGPTAKGRTGPILHQNEDVLAGRNPNSRVEENLEAGAYTVEATTYGGGVTGEFEMD